MLKENFITYIVEQELWSVDECFPDANDDKDGTENAVRKIFAVSVNITVSANKIIKHLWLADIRERESKFMENFQICTFQSK